MRVFVTRQLPGSGIDRLSEHAAVELWQDEGPPPYEDLVARSRDCDGLLCLLTDRVDESVLHGLRVASQMAVGVDNIDLSAATRLGVPIGHTPGVLTETTADLTWALLLAVARRVTESERFLRDGRWTTWSPSLLCGSDVHGATLGIVGKGAIGRAVARRAAGFGMRVLFATRSRESLEEMLDQSDIVSIHCSLNDESRGLIGPDELERMKRSAILINTARGPIVDELSLTEALRSRTIAGAGLDVFESEPLAMDSPLLELDNVVLVPHIGSASIATRTRMADMAVDNLIAGLTGERLPNCANPDVYA